ncbi:SCO family protein [Variovorax ginsengisoli]|uniref:Protein SCO1/2 n=1 Tax=Variovorax ginsengisoli TaxID=363844 RepID=A0ABT9S9Q0_9BURK|nr:SCO family protein [Variovorax ginsengisoli]MDP9901086.1 protein SCO1/2 [Variovorax ginsengisoli]
MNPSKPVSSCCGAGGQAAPERPAPIDGRFELIDHFGRPVNERSFGDRHLLVFFGFSHCAVVCPRELAKLGTALERLGPLAQRVQALYVTVDPQRDDPASMRAYVARYPGGFIGLTGTIEQVAAAKKSYRVFAEPVPDADAPDGYVVPHTAFAYLMAPGGRYETHLPDALGVDAVVERLRRHLV